MVPPRSCKGSRPSLRFRNAPGPRGGRYGRTRGAGEAIGRGPNTTATHVQRTQFPVLKLSRPGVWPPAGGPAAGRWRPKPGQKPRRPGCDAPARTPDAWGRPERASVRQLPGVGGGLRPGRRQSAAPHPHAKPLALQAGGINHTHTHTHTHSALATGN